MNRDSKSETCCGCPLLCCPALSYSPPPGQQRNVSLYITHLLLDTAALMYAWQAMIETWLGLSETTGVTRTGSWGFNYIVCCYVLELTWRRSVDTMLAVHHVGTIVIILLYAGEFLVRAAATAGF
jgi:hypothetical protein